VVWLGLTLSLVSAVAVNWAYTREHDAVARLPPLSARRPLRAAATLVSSSAWRAAFATECAGFLLYLAALRLAPLALVQTVGAAGIAVLAAASSGGRLSTLPPRERAASALVIGGLALLGLSLVGEHPGGHQPHWGLALAWLGACAAAAALLGLARVRTARAVSLGLSAGLLFSAGDISAKLAVVGGSWLLVVLPLIAAYALGSIELQAAFQHGGALTAAGCATVVANAVPIAAGVVLFREGIPPGARGVVQVAAFATLLAGAALLNDPRALAHARDQAPGRATAAARPPQT
jgi:hypothetical protein